MANPPKVQAILPGFITSTLIDVVEPLLALQKTRRLKFRAVHELFQAQGQPPAADLVIFCRNTEPRFQRILEQILARGMPYIYDLDDNLFEIPLELEIGRYHRAPERIAMLSRYLEYASLVRVYSRPLLEKVQAINPKVELVTAPINWPAIQSASPKAHPGLVKLIYATSRQEDPLAGIFLPALETLLKKYQSQVQMTFWGECPASLKNYPNVRRLDFLSNYQRYLHQFVEEGFDIGLAPMLSDPFYLSKTNNKFREYAAAGIAGVYSNVPVYAEVLDGQTGLLVENSTSAWLAALERLITEREFCAQVGKQAKTYIQSHYSQEEFYAVWQRQIETALSSSPPSARLHPPAPALDVPPGISPGSGQKKSLSRVLSSIFRRLENILWMVKINWLKRL